jgi:hypothetical protein
MFTSWKYTAMQVWYMVLFKRGSDGPQFNKLNTYIGKLNTEVSVLLRYKAVSVGKQFLPFKKI